MDYLSLLQGINEHIVTGPSLILDLIGFRLAEFGDYVAFLLLLLLLGQQELKICQKRENNKKCYRIFFQQKMTKKNRIVLFKMCNA